MDIMGGTTLSNLTPAELTVLYHGCLSVERMAIDRSPMQRVAHELAQKLRPIVGSY